MRLLALGRFTLPVFVLLSFSTVLSATVIGPLDLANCGGGGVTVSATSIDWLPSGGGTGCVLTGTNTNVTSAVGPLGPGVTGAIKDLDFVLTPLPVADFLTFASVPGLTFTLDLLGPGPASTVCAGLPLFGTCAAFTNSPFALQRTPTGTAVVLSLGGSVSDGTVPTSLWAGAFTTQITGQTPAQIQATINGGGSVTSTHSGSFDITVNPIPEPGTMLMLGSGLLLTGLLRRRRA